jgi:hypothetical protein
VNLAAYKPLKVIYKNSRCEVLIAQALDYELRKRCKKGTIAVKTVSIPSPEYVACCSHGIEISVINDKLLLQ